VREPARVTFVAGLAAAAVVCTGTAFAQDRRCMPGGVCCTVVGHGARGPDQRCGTLEEFQRYAKIVCLEADAIENKSLPESIEAWGRCTAAKIAAQKVEAAQRENAADHQRAIEARRQLREMGVDPDRAPGTGQLAAEDCFMGECFREFIVSISRGKPGLVTARTRIEHYCGAPNPSECAAIERDMRALPGEASYKIQCGSPGGYVEWPDGRRVSEPDPDPPHATRAARQLWTAICSMVARR